MSVRRVGRLNFGYAPWSWRFVNRRRREIDAFFLGECKENPSLWNGRLLLLRDVQFAERVLSGTFFEADYASLLAALAWEAMGPTVKACFPGAAIFGSDEGLILGEMASHTRNAGQLVFPSGPSSVRTLPATKSTSRERFAAKSWRRQVLSQRCSRPKTAGTRFAPGRVCH